MDIPAEQNLIDSVAKCASFYRSDIMDCNEHPASCDVLKAFQCEEPEDWQMFYYKDKDISGLHISWTCKNTVSPRNG